MPGLRERARRPPATVRLSSATCRTSASRSGSANASHQAPRGARDRLAEFPAISFLEGGRFGRGRPLVVRADHAAGHECEAMVARTHAEAAHRHHRRLSIPAGTAISAGHVASPRGRRDARCAHRPEAVEIQIDDGSRVEREHLAHEQAADDRDARAAGASPRRRRHRAPAAARRASPPSSSS